MQGTVSTGEVSGVLVTSAVLVAIFAPLTIRLYATKS
jgi:hypothetical protein